MHTNKYTQGTMQSTIIKDYAVHSYAKYTFSGCSTTVGFLIQMTYKSQVHQQAQSEETPDALVCFVAGLNTVI